ncbi:MAG: hypothetical protein J5653_00080 [Clostridiales bacterium]|nr:hypothetical protein [Clostridiales bacterium]
MKKLVAILMTVAVVAAMTGCKDKKETKVTEKATEKIETVVDNGDEKLVQLLGMKRTEEPNMIGQVGGWDGNVENIDLNQNEKAKAAFEKATSELTGMVFEGIYLLGTQVVAGTNYCILARGTATVPDAIPGYYLVYVYEDLQGGAEVLKIDALLEADGEVDGGWGVNTGDPTFENNVEVKDAFAKALANMVIAGGEMEPIAYLGSQVVGGYNYLVLCRVRAVVEDPSVELALVTIYVDPEGNASITTDDMNFSAQDEIEDGIEASETSQAEDDMMEGADA